MQTRIRTAFAIGFLATVTASSIAAQAPAAAPPAPAAGPPRAALPPMPRSAPIGSPITLEQARQVVAAAEAEATRRNLTATIAIVDPAGNLVYFQKATGAPYTAEDMAVKKARSAARNRRTTQYDAQRVAAGVATLAYLPDIFPFPGGVPIVADGKLIGAIGETGGADQEVAEAGAAAIK